MMIEKKLKATIIGTTVSKINVIQLIILILQLILGHRCQDTAPIVTTRMLPDITSNGIDSTMMMTNTDQDSDTSDPQSRPVTTTKGIIHNIISCSMEIYVHSIVSS